MKSDVSMHLKPTRDRYNKSCITRELSNCYEPFTVVTYSNKITVEPERLPIPRGHFYGPKQAGRLQERSVKTHFKISRGNEPLEVLDTGIV